MTQKEYNKIKKHLSKVEKIMGYESGFLIKSLNITEPSPIVIDESKFMDTKLCAFIGVY